MSASFTPASFAPASMPIAPLPAALSRRDPAGALEIAVLAFDGISPFHLSVPGLVFGEARPALAGPAFNYRLCAQQPGSLRTSGGFEIQVAHGLEILQSAGIIVIPSWPATATTEATPAPLLDALRDAHARGALLMGLCLGAFPLAESGLLDGCQATTHWAWAETFAQRFPRVAFDPQVLYVDNGALLTSAGTVAGIDCCLHLARRLWGADYAARLARLLVTPPHRQGNQAQYIEQPLPRHGGDERLAATLDWARSQLHQALDVDTLAARALMSRRSFTRHFRQTTGTSVLAWLTQQRLARAQRLLETSRLSVEQIAAEAGFGSALSLRQHFSRAFNTTPGQYRREFLTA